jgi:hypothetical protein
MNVIHRVCEIQKGQKIYRSYEESYLHLAYDFSFIYKDALHSVMTATTFLV